MEGQGGDLGKGPPGAMRRREHSSVEAIPGSIGANRNATSGTPSETTPHDSEPVRSNARPGERREAHRVSQPIGVT
jgi:hypothetical protein